MMKNHSYTFTVEKPCSESWEKMSAAELGKFCLSCQHEVVDFSTFTDEEIIRYIFTSTGKVCGRFKPTQLNRPMQLPQHIQRPNPFKYVVAGLMAVTLLPACSSDSEEVKLQVVEVPVMKVNKELALLDDTMFFRGRVVDVYDRPVKAATITLTGNTLHAQTDDSGRFSILLPDSLIGMDFEVEVQAEGMELYLATVPSTAVLNNQEEMFTMYVKEVAPQPKMIMGDIQLEVLGNISVHKEEMPVPQFIPYKPVE